MNQAAVSSHVMFDLETRWPESMRGYDSPASASEQVATGRSKAHWHTRQSGIGELKEGSTKTPTTIASDASLYADSEALGSDCTAFGGTIALDLWQAFDSECLANVKRALATFQTYKSRIAMLCAEGEHDETILNPDSERDFWRFVESNPFMRKAQLVLLENGNLRAIWKNGPDKHLGLQFLGGEMGQYVIFTQRPHTSKVSRVAGRDSLDALKKEIIDAYDLQQLLGT